MRILHIGDLHFKKKNKYEQSKVIQALLNILTKEEAIDLIFFSGDLVNNGSIQSDFKEADDFLFEPLLKSLNVLRDDVFICAGNHDIDRSVIVNSIITNFSEKKNVDRKFLENWYDKQIADRKASLQSTINFQTYLGENFKYPENDVLDPLYSVHKRVLQDKSIGIVTLNTSWFCSGEREDKTQLIVLPNIIEDAVTKLEGCDLKIILMHHPLNYLKQTLSYEVEDLIHSNFNLLLVGHVHKEFIETQFRCNNGIYCNTTKASLCDDGGEIGFSILEIDPNEVGTIKVKRYHYIKPENLFSPIESVIVTIPLGEAKHKQNSIRKKISSKFSYELNEANKLLLNYNESNDQAFLESFTDPVLSKDSDEETNISDKVSKLVYSEIVESSESFLLFGKDKCGKTTLLKKIQIDLLRSYSNKGQIPIYLDYKQLEINENGFNLHKIVANYFNLTRSDVEGIVMEGRLLLLIDNLNTSSSLHKEIVGFLSEHSNNKFIICSEYLTSRIYGEELDGLLYQKCFFKNLTRNELRIYTKKNPAIKSEDQEVVMEKVTNFCKQLHLPLSYWTISLILLIYKKSNDDYTKNLFSVLDSCVDEILMKKKFLFEKTNLKFEQYKILCSEIAASLFQDYSEFEYSCTYSEMLAIVEGYVDKNRRIIVSAKDIVDYLHECGILKSKLDNKYTFRLNGLFEYFLAYHLKENIEFKERIILDPSTYLAFKNEIEIYSGFNRSDKEFLKNIFNKTRDALQPFKIKYSSNLDDTLLGKIEGAYQFDETLKKLLVKSPLSDESKDMIFDKMDTLDIDSDVHLKPVIDEKKLNVEVVERYLIILSRVLKNSDGVTDSVLIYNIFDYLLETYCQFGFYIIDDFERVAKEENLKVREAYEVEDDLILGEEILKLLSRILPVLVQAMMYEGIGQLNFSKIIEDKIRELRTSISTNQYKLFVLYFLLMDIDLKSNKVLIEDVFSEITLSPLKVATLFKLNFYHAFKAYQNRELETFVKTKIQQAQIRIDSKSDIDKMQKGLSKTSKRNLARRLKRR